MRSSVFFVAMMAAAVSANPVLKVIEEVKTVTEYVKPGQAIPTPAPPVKSAVPAPAPVPQSAAPAAASSNGGSFEQNQPSKPKPSSSSSSSSGSSSSGNQMLDVANKWRKKYGLQPFTWDESLVSNCEETGKNNDGDTENHFLIPHTNMAQVITPGQQVAKGDTKGMSTFEVAYIAWLCEVNTDPELQASANDGIDVCDVVQNTITMAYGGETGHHDILTNPEWTTIACSFTAKHGQVDASAQFQGLYVCDCGK